MSEQKWMNFEEVKRWQEFQKEREILALNTGNLWKANGFKGSMSDYLPDGRYYNEAVKIITSVEYQTKTYDE